MYSVYLLYLTGIIPGPQEPPGNINTFLKPLVDDMLQLWNGIPLVPEGPPVLRAALVCVTSDLPAMRKITQFLGHKADLGCSRCKFCAKREPGSVGATGKMSYFTPTMAEERKTDEVVQQAEEYKQARRLQRRLHKGTVFGTLSWFGCLILTS